MLFTWRNIFLNPKYTHNYEHFLIENPCGGGALIW